MTVERGIARATVGLTIGIGIARVLGWFRFVVIAWAFGVAGSLDAFFAAFRMPDLMYQLVAAGALSAALIPTITSLLAAGERERAGGRVGGDDLWRRAAALAVLWPSRRRLARRSPWLRRERSAQLVDLTRIMLLASLPDPRAVATSVLTPSGGSWRR
jgi:putative peptidoglycan lipid II flippase